MEDTTKIYYKHISHYIPLPNTAAAASLVMYLHSYSHLIGKLFYSYNSFRNAHFNAPTFQIGNNPMTVFPWSASHSTGGIPWGSLPPWAPLAPWAPRSAPCPAEAARRGRRTSQTPRRGSRCRLRQRGRGRGSPAPDAKITGHNNGE